MKVGIQLYSVRNNMEQNAIKTIEQVVKLGYKYLETANYNATQDSGIGFSVSPKEVSKLLRDNDANIVSAHMAPMKPDTMKPILEYHTEIGTKFIVMPMDFYHSIDDVLKKAEDLNKIGEQCKEYGLELLYHNHYYEFQKMGEKTIYETLLANMDPALVKIELDSYWALRGGQEPIALLKTLGKRVRLLHQKDFPKNMADKLVVPDELNATGKTVDMKAFEQVADPKAFTEIGTGIMDIQSIIDTANTFCNVDYMILEQDYSQIEEMESVALSMKEFKKFRGISW